MFSEMRTTLHKQNNINNVTIGKYSIFPPSFPTIMVDVMREHLNKNCIKHLNVRSNKTSRR